jgi:hypothetical protein
MPISLSQIELVAGICELIDKQAPGLTVDVKQYSAIITAANAIVDAFEAPAQPAQAGIGYAAWLQSDDVGASSKCMAQYLLGETPSQINHPHDPADFARCRKLLEAVPELAPRLNEMKAASSVWACLVEGWDELCRLMDEEAPRWREGKGSSPKTYDRMKALGC